MRADQNQVVEQVQIELSNFERAQELKNISITASSEAENMGSLEDKDHSAYGQNYQVTLSFPSLLMVKILEFKAIWIYKV